MVEIVSSGLIGLSLGAQYALLALGFTLIFGIIGVVNFAHGGFYLLGGYLAYAGVGLAGLPYPVAVVAASFATAALGYFFELLLLEEAGAGKPAYFTVESWRTIIERRGGRGTPATAEATVKLHAGGERRVSTGEGNGPVDALNHALRHALLGVYPELEPFVLIDFKVRILDSQLGTDAVTRVLIETTDGSSSWSTVGVGPNLIEASWEALTDSVIWGLYKAGVPAR